MTLKDIAKIAGTSVATVSYALNNSDKVSDSVKEKIQRIAEETGYQPDPRAQALRTGRTRMIGIVTEDLAFSFTASIIRGVYRFAEANKYQVILSDSGLKDKIGSNYEHTFEYQEEINKRVNLLDDYYVDGIIYIGMHDRDITGLLESRRPIVYTYCFTDSKEDYMILYDNYRSAYEVTQYLIHMGHRRIGLIRGLAHSNPSNERFLGYQKALMEAKIPLELSYVKSGDWSFEKGYEACMELLKMPDPPTAVFALNDKMAWGVLEAAAQCNVKVPGELSVVGYDNYEMCNYVRPKLTSVSLPVEEMGYLAGQMIDDICNKSKVVKERKITLPCKLVIRDTVCNRATRNE